MLETVLGIIGAITFIILWNKVLYQKNVKPIEASVLSCVYLYMILGVIAAVLSVLKIGVNLLTTSCGIWLVNIALFIYEYKKKMLKRGVNIEVRHLGALAGVIAFIVVMALWHFGVKLELIYIDIDSSRYFKDAMDVRRTQQISGEYLAVLFQALVISCISPFVKAVSLYKGMILAHIFMQVLSGCMFFELISRLNTGKYKQIVNMVLTILYVYGFQFYILTYGTFFHLQDAVLIVMFLIYHLLELQKKEEGAVFAFGSILFGCYALMVCYPVYMIVMLVLLIPEIIIWIVNKIHMVDIRQRVGLFVSVLAVALAGIYFASQRTNTFNGLLLNLKAEGVSYREPFLDFIFFIPFGVVYIILLLRKKYKNEQKIILRMNIEGLLFMTVWLVFYVKGYLSNYYFYRFYNAIWLLAWIMVAHALYLLEQERQILFVGSYAALYGFAVFTSVCGINRRISDYNSDLFLENKENQTLCPLYAFNTDKFVNRAEPAVSEELFEAYQYIIDNLGSEEVRMLDSYYTYMSVHWYMAITDIDHVNNYNDIRGTCVYDVLNFLDETNTKYILLEKKDNSWMQFYDTVFAAADVEYENDKCYILTKKSGYWADLLQRYADTDQRVQILKHIRDNFAPQQIRILCEETDEQMNLSVYKAYAKDDCDEYIGTITPKNLKKKLKLLDKDKIECAVVFKDTEMYLKNQEYFDGLNIVYENEAGMVVGPVNDRWVIENE